MIELSRRAAENRAQSLLKELEEELTELRKRSAALSQLTLSEDYVHFLKVDVVRLLQHPCLKVTLPDSACRLALFFCLADISWTVRTPTNKGLVRSQLGVRADLGVPSEDGRSRDGADTGGDAEVTRKL